MKDNFFDKKIGWKLKERRKPSSRRNRAHPRTLKTYQNKTQKLKVKYTTLFNQSYYSKEDFKKLSETKKSKILKSISQKRIEPKPFFCDKYSTFENWLIVLKVKQIGKTREKSSSVLINPTKETIWGK